MMEELTNYVKEFVRKIGIKKVLIGIEVILILGFILSITWKMEKDVRIEPIVPSDVVLAEQKVIKVTRTAKAGDSFSVLSLSSDMIIEINNEIDTISTFKELVSACNDMSQKKEKLVIPKGAGFTEFGGIGIYTWLKSGQHFVTGTDFNEMHAIIFLDGRYVSVSFYLKQVSLSMGVDIDTGSY